MEAQPLHTSAPQPPAAHPPAFAALPVRARGVLDILDLSLRLYKRYFWVLVAWSAIVAVANSLSSSLLYIFLWPLLTGATVCCVAAAIRGQRVEFKQCWQFTNPRYWPLVGVIFLTFLYGIGIFLLLGLACVAIFAGGALLLQSASFEVKLAIGIIGGIVMVVLLTIAATGLMIWQGMAPIVVCMEEDKRDRSALGRAYELLRGHWGRMIAMLTVIGLAVLVLYAILAATIGSITGMFTGFARLGDVLNGRLSFEEFMDAFTGFSMGFQILVVFLTTLWNPIHHLILTLFYLDIRVRKEALDLEWTSYASSPPTAAPASPQGGSTPPVESAPAYAAPVEVSTFAARPTPPEPLEAPVSPAPPTIDDAEVNRNEANDSMPNRPENV